VALAVYLAPQAALAAWTWWNWGNLGGPLTMMELPPFSWEAFRAGSLGVLVDRENGLFTWSPLCLLAPAAWAAAGRRHWPWLVPAAHQHWWGGFSPAARFLVPAMPIVALVGAGAWPRRPFRLASLVLLLPQAFIAADGWLHTRSLWPQGDGHNRVLADLLGWIGVGETSIPSLRTAPEMLWPAAILVALAGAINLAIAVAARRQD
jgi:hypothetical protein